MNYNTNCKNKKPLIILMTFLYLINYFIFNLFTSKYPKTEVTIKHKALYTVTDDIPKVNGILSPKETDKTLNEYGK